MAAYEETTFDISHPNPEVQKLVAIIRSPEGKLEGGTPSAPQSIALLCHGIQAHKNQTYHRSLAAALSDNGIPSIRWDFQGNGDSGGESSFGDLWKEEEDYDCVWSWLEEHGWRPDIGLSLFLDCFRQMVTFGGTWTVIAHSRGSITGNRYLCTLAKRHPSRSVPKYFVNLSARYVMARLLQRIDLFRESFESQGYVEVKSGKRVDRGTKEQIIDFATFDTSQCITDFPRDTHVLTVHGTKDTVVPFGDGEIYHLIFSERGGKGTAEMKALDGGDHNFIGKNEVVVEYIMEWLLRLRRVEGNTQAKM
ncbi:alpha/beta-hydrolase [Atractiella rhizophila]|nr:alpha/beta-hydrolase [Atractiella rhizophila]